MDQVMTDTAVLLATGVSGFALGAVVSAVVRRVRAWRFERFIRREFEAMETRTALRRRLHAVAAMPKRPV